MKVWFDALTSKQALIAVYLKRTFEAHDHKFLITCRNYDYLVSLMRLYGVEPIVYGSYGETLEAKVRTGLEREIFLLNLWSSSKPHVHISLTSPEASRIAFRLKIPIVLLTDSPHSIYVNKLTIPLADVLITPACIPKSAFTHLIDPNRIVQFKGLFEVMWIKDLAKAEKEPLLEPPLGLRPLRYVVIRPEERKASYYQAIGEEPTSACCIISQILDETDLKVVFFPRYSDQREYVSKLFRQHIGRRIIIPDKAMRAPPLLYNAVAVITGGLTMATEASLLGTPAITYFPKSLPVMEFLIERGSPLMHVHSAYKASELLSKILNSPRRYRKDTRPLLELLEDPSYLILAKAEEISK